MSLSACGKVAQHAQLINEADWKYPITSASIRLICLIDYAINLQVIVKML
jgi:hypothetical protein